MVEKFGGTEASAVQRDSLPASFIEMCPEARNRWWFFFVSRDVSTVTWILSDDLYLILSDQILYLIGPLQISPPFIPMWRPEVYDYYLNPVHLPSPEGLYTRRIREIGVFRPSICFCCSHSVPRGIYSADVCKYNRVPGRG